MHRHTEKGTKGIIADERKEGQHLSSVQKKTGEWKRANQETEEK